MRLFRDTFLRILPNGCNRGDHPFLADFDQKPPPANPMMWMWSIPSAQLCNDSELLENFEKIGRLIKQHCIENDFEVVEEYVKLRDVDAIPFELLSDFCPPGMPPAPQHVAINLTEALHY